MERCGRDKKRSPNMTIFLSIACGAIATYFLLTAFFSTRRELAWARMALRAMFGEPIAGERLRAMAVAGKPEASALLLELGRYYRSDYERHGKDYADTMARDVYARVAVAMVSPSRAARA
jgi:hypothetical protein